MRSRAAVTLAVIALVGWSAVAGADELFSYYGTTFNGPQFNRPGVNPPFTPTGVVVSFQAQTFQVNQTSTCYVASIQNGLFDGFLHIYQAAFNPINSSQNVLVANDDGPLGIGSSQTAVFTAQANTPYFVVTSAFQAGANGDFQNTISCNSTGLPNPLVITHGNCTNQQTGTRTCLTNDRFLVSATFTVPGGQPTDAHVVQYGSGDSALFWFFGPQNFELLLKVLNFCGLNENAYRVFSAGTTTVGVTVTVLDTVRGGSATIINPQGAPFQNQVVPIPNSCP